MDFLDWFGNPAFPCRGRHHIVGEILHSEQGGSHCVLLYFTACWDNIHMVCPPLLQHTRQAQIRKIIPGTRGAGEVCREVTTCRYASSLK